jgi:hypothetical protein
MVRSTRKQSKKTLKTRKPTPYPKPLVLSTQSYMNVSQTWKNGEGRRNTVMIRNGQGVKKVERLGPQGQVLETKVQKLTTPEKSHILAGRFVPGLWRNCTLCKE